jgi:hypothetical protein
MDSPRDNPRRFGRGQVMDTLTIWAVALVLLLAAVLLWRNEDQ